MNADIIAVMLGILAAIIFVIFFLWRMHIRKTAARQLEEEFLKEDEQ